MKQLIRSSVFPIIVIMGCVVLNNFSALATDGDKAQVLRYVRDDIPGDVNGDAAISSDDLTIVLHSVAGNPVGPGPIMFPFDIDGNRVTGMPEAIYIWKILRLPGSSGESGGNAAMTVGNATAKAGEQVSIEITAEGDVDNIAGAAFALEYSSDIFLDDVRTDFFEFIATKVNLSRTVIAAAGPESDGEILFTLNFTVKDDISPGKYDITIKSLDEDVLYDSSPEDPTGITTSLSGGSVTVSETCSCEGLYTEEQMNKMVEAILTWGDTDGDKKIGLSEAIRALRVTSGVTEPASEAKK